MVRRSSVKGLLGQNRNQLKALLRESLQEVLEAEMTDALGAASGARTDGRLGCRDGHFSTELFVRYQRSEKALVAALAEMYVQGGIHTQGQSDHRRTVRAQLLGDDDQPDQQGLGYSA